MTQLFANAPVTWGVWGPHSLPAGRTPLDILKTLSQAGYTGVELGPLGFFGRDATETAEVLYQYRLRSAGAYVPLRPLHGAEVMAADLANLRAVCMTLAACPDTGPVVLAEETEPELKRHVRRGNSAPELDLSAAQWTTLIEGMAEAGRIAADFGLPVTYHPHAGTHVEQPHEVDRFLSGCDLAITLDTGHAAAGGDDPIDLLHRWGDRVNHVHVKDLKLAPVLKAQQEGLTFGMAEASAALGEGDLDLAGFMAALAERNYRGWIVVEQDRRPDGGHDHASVDAEQFKNLEWVRAHSSWLAE